MNLWLESVPLYWAKILGTIFFLCVIVWALTRPRAYIYRGAPDTKRWRDLRIWAVIILMVQIVIYLQF